MTLFDPAFLIIYGTKIPYEERSNSRSRRISIRVGPERVRVTIPRGVTRQEVRNFVLKNEAWIYDNWLKIQQKLLEIPKRKYSTGETISLLGQDIQLEIRKANQKMISLRYLKEEHKITVILPELIEPEDEQEEIQAILLKWYKTKAREVFQHKLNEWSRRMGVKYNAFRMKEQKTRWGSCSGKGNINLNWRAVMAPENVIDYLVIHELAHLKHMNHSSAFWDFVSRYCPEYKARRQWLKVNGQSLVL